MQTVGRILVGLGLGLAGGLLPAAHCWGRRDMAVFLDNTHKERRF